MRKYQHSTRKITTKKNRKFIKRKSAKARRRTGWFRYYFDVVRTAKRKGKKLKKEDLPQFPVYFHSPRTQPPRPEFSDNILFLAQHKEAFSKKSVDLPADGVFKVPEIFSLTANQEASFLLLKRLFYALYNDKLETIKIDYHACNRIDLDASISMDILLKEFIVYYKRLWRFGYESKLKLIRPINYEKEAIKKILFSIGGFANIKGFKAPFTDILPFHLMIGDNFSPQRGRDQEREVTKLGDYIVECLKRMGYPELSWEAEDNFAKVIGEVLINACEHSGHRYRYSIGYLQDVKIDGHNSGVFNLVIFDFGNTIYQTFKSPELADTEVVKRMTALSEKYTASGLFKPREFEEESLWTLYALQDGVTSVKDKKRGHGTMHFIESFFQLKGDLTQDNLSSLTILSGNTRITFDGKYTIREVPRGKDGRLYKMMTFNHSGRIEDPPDKNYVTFADNFFPGTMIVAKICIKFNNSE